jgi:hypothetical protein
VVAVGVETVDHFTLTHELVDFELEVVLVGEVAAIEFLETFLSQSKSTEYNVIKFLRC